MKAPYVGVIGMVCAIVLSGAPVTPARASAQVNLNLLECQESDESLSDLTRTAAGIATLSAIDTPREVTCAVPYSSSHDRQLPGAFVVIDGDNKNGAQTRCTIFTFDNSGVMRASQQFVTTDAKYEEFFVLSAQDVGSGNNYMSITCLLPAHGNGLLRGAIVLE